MGRGAATTWGALEEPLLDQERLVDLFQRPGIFPHRNRYGVEADRATPATSTAALMASPFLRELQRLQLLNAC